MYIVRVLKRMKLNKTIPQLPRRCQVQKRLEPAQLLSPMGLGLTIVALQTRDVLGTGSWKGDSTLKQYFVLPKNGSKH